MTWCSKIYDIFNGWTDEDHELPSTPATKSINGRPESSITSNLKRYQQNNDSPFLERTSSISSIINPSEYKIKNRSHRHYSYGDQCYSSEDRPYGVATISNISLNLPNNSKFMPDLETYLQDQTLSRSYSFELPSNNSHLSTMDLMSPSARYFPSEQRNHMEKNFRSSSINGLVNSAMIGSQVSLTNRKESLAPRLSTHSSYSVPEYESQISNLRNHEHVEEMIRNRIKEMFVSSAGRPLPMVYEFPQHDPYRHLENYQTEGGYDDPSQWVIQTKIAPVECRVFSDNVASIYANQFFDQYHYNLWSIDDQFNPVVMSIKPHENKITIIVRTKQNSKCLEVLEDQSNPINHVELCRRVNPSIRVEHFENCTNFKAQQHIKNYDEKLETQKFKFGVIYQRRGQTTEEEFFNNERHGRALDEFLDIIATRVSLKNFKGYRAGLDVSEQTDCPISYYELYDHKEIMFHVSTLLPFTRNDTAQIQRKRHIGNDIVTIVFQEENTPFHPSMIKSNFLHVFLVVQPVQVLSRTCYKMTLVTRDGIESFPPTLHRNVVYVRNAEQFKPFILSKLINAEYAAYRCRTFSLLQERTRCSYLKTLCENLTEKSYEALCDEVKRTSQRRLSIISNSTKKRYLTNVKKIFTRSNSTPDGTQHQPVKNEFLTREKDRRKSKQKFFRPVTSIDSNENPRSSVALSLPDHELGRDNILVNRRVNGRSNESLNSSGDMVCTEQRVNNCPPVQRSVATYYADESDEGLDSMSSADTAASQVRVPYDSDDQDAYRQKLRERSQPSHSSIVMHPWHRLMGHRSGQVQIYTPQTAGIHISEAATV